MGVGGDRYAHWVGRLGHTHSGKAGETEVPHTQTGNFPQTLREYPSIDFIAMEKDVYHLARINGGQVLSTAMHKA